MEQDELEKLIKQRRNKYFRDYYKNNKEAVLRAHKKYWEQKIKQETENKA